MMKDSLNLVKEIPENADSVISRKTLSKRDQAKANYDRIWLQNPEKFSCERTALKKDKYQRVLNLILKYTELKDKKVVDLGCGNGYFSRMLCNLGAEVDAVDISQNALKELRREEHEGIHPIQDYIPASFLADEAYRLVVCIDLIAELDEPDYRTFFSELSRIVTSDGLVVCSTSIDIDSDDALQYFSDLAATEFEFLEWSFSYHLLHIKLSRLLKAPSRYVKAWKSNKYRTEEIQKRHFLSKMWFQLNSTIPCVCIWFCVQYLTNPIVNFLNKNLFVGHLLEKISKFFWRESAISHAIFIGKRRRLVSVSHEAHPKELKHKKQVWE